MWARSFGLTRPRAIGCDSAGGWLIASQARHENFSRTCWITFYWRGMSSNVSVTSSPILRKAAAARACQGCRIDNPFARQMLGQGTACRPAPFERRHRDHVAPCCGSHLRRCLGLRSIRFQIGELKLELIKQRAALRGLAEPIVPELPDGELELLDQQRPVLCLALRRRSSQFSRTQGLTLRDDERMVS